MQPLRKFLRLTARERRLLVSAAFCLVAMRLGLWVLPFRTLLSQLPQVTSEPDRWRGRWGWQVGICQEPRIVWCGRWPHG